MKLNPKSCPKCQKKLIKVTGEGYDSIAEKHVEIHLARICRNCKTIFISLEFDNFKIEYDNIGA